MSQLFTRHKSFYAYSKGAFLHFHFPYFCCAVTSCRYHIQKFGANRLQCARLWPIITKGMRYVPFVIVGRVYIRIRISSYLVHVIRRYLTYLTYLPYLTDLTHRTHLTYLTCLTYPPNLVPGRAQAGPSPDQLSGVLNCRLLRKHCKYNSKRN